jgi:hypothetical protein
MTFKEVFGAVGCKFAKAHATIDGGSMEGPTKVLDIR